jgi:cholesterol transport system auxiliary component
MKRAAALLPVILLGGCNTLNTLVPAPSPPPAMHALAPLAGAKAGAQASAVEAAAAQGPTLVVSPPQAAAGFDSPRMMYVREAGKLEYFAHNRWSDTPARLLAPLVVAAAQSSGAFRAVVRAPSPALGELRLDTEILRLQQEFGGAPSRVRFTLRAYLVEGATRRVMALREFEAVVPAASEDPQGGVLAAQEAIRTVLAELAAFCAEVARR